MEILLNNAIFETLTYNYGINVLSEERMKTVSSLGDPSVLHRNQK